MKSIRRLSVESLLKVVAYTLIFAFKLRHRRLSAKKLQIFFAGCHFLRQVRQFAVHKTAVIEEISSELMSQVLKSHGYVDNCLDCGNILLCSSEFLPELWKSPSGWVLAQWYETRWIKTIPLPIRGMGNKCFANQQLIHNFVGNRPFNPKEAFVQIFPETFNQLPSCLAQTAHVAVANAPIVEGDVDTLLKSYFASPKYVQDNDLLQLNGNTCCKVKVITLPGERKNVGFFIEHGKTSLYEVNNESMLRPSINVKLKNSQVKRHFDSYEQIVSCLVPQRPYGLSDYCLKMVETIAPFVRNSCSSRTSVKSSLPYPTFLISGTAGSGKRTVVKCVAETLGLQFVETSCLALLGESSKATELRLKNVIFNAQKMSPAVLYLTDLEVQRKNSIILPLFLYYQLRIFRLSAKPAKELRQIIDFRDSLCL